MASKIYFVVIDTTKQPDSREYAWYNSASYMNDMAGYVVDFAGIRQFEADFKAKKKLDKRMEGYVKVGGSLFKLVYLIKAVRFMEHIGTDELMLSADGRRAALAVSGDSKMLLMPVYPREKFEDYEVCYGN